MTVDGAEHHSYGEQTDSQMQATVDEGRSDASPPQVMLRIDAPTVLD